jgi:phosphate transport system ATP-binding protein
VPASAAWVTDDAAVNAPVTLRDAPEVAVATRSRLAAHELNAYFGAVHAIKGVTLAIPDRAVTAVIGPSGCGKSTFLRCLNRMHETIPGARATGRVLLDGTDIYAHGSNPIRVRRHIGMVFQRPTPFPTMSVRDNVAAGLRILNEKPGKRETDAIVERALRRAALWDEVKDRLNASATALSGGQQQRLCIARALANRPELLLLDEPASALDPIATQKIEELLYELKSELTIMIVTHNLQQAARASNHTAFFVLGELIEFGPTERIFTRPLQERTDAYITGRFG